MLIRNLVLRGAVVAALAGLAPVALAVTPVFINEIHYDDSTAAGDVGEAVEIIGPAGTNLSGWTVVLYNGSGGASYSTLNLSGTIANQCGGYGTVNVPAVGLQNGAPDGIALVQGTTVKQFLSYEGTFAATNGPANGMTSVDIGVSETNGTAPGTSLQLTGSGTNYEDFAWQGSSAASFGQCNVGQSFGPPVDAPPAVASTTPTHNATGIASNANLAVTFTEPVTLGATWYAIQCSTSGAHTAVQGGSGASYTLDPAVDFASGETCTVTISAAQVVDIDAPADAMLADHTFSFSTAGDLPPTVQASTPADGASAFPLASNLSIQFSESVTLDANWYTLSCNSSGAHTAVQGGSGASYTLNPDTDFAALEHCTLTVIANRVHDQDGTIHDMPANVVIGFDTAGSSGGDYYAGVDTTTGPALKAWLHNRIKDHTSVPYSGATPNTWTVLEAADQDPADPNKVLDVYKNESYTKVGAGNTNYNREHTWPNSLGFPNNSVNGHVNAPYTDCHMLYISHIGYNSDRGNSKYNNCSGCTERATTANHGFGGPGQSNYFNSDNFEVWGHRKGDMARAVMYMAVRYKGGTNAVTTLPEPNLELTDTASQIVGVNAQPTSGTAYMGLKSVLLAWHQADPPDAAERLRNDVVFSYQNNRNPFIDHPEWAECVFDNTNCPVVSDVIFENGFE
ncbi:MAG TPA: endonuclease [Tahibacter sp.]|nr:endonuclease [Tahibacter sp.]